MPACEICKTESDKLSVRPCVACTLPACSKCRGDEGDGYWNHNGKKGYACVTCIGNNLAFEGGALAVARELKAYADAILLPKVMAAVDARLDRVRDEIVPPIVDSALLRVEKLTANTLHEAEETSGRLVARLETAIGSQRVEVKTDVQEIVQALTSALSATLVRVAIVIGLVNLVGIAAALLLAKAMLR